MDNVILIKYKNTFDFDLEEDKYYEISFFKPNSEIIYPNDKYVKRGSPFNDVVEYYSELLTHYDKKMINMKYKGLSKIDNKYLFEIDVTSILRSLKLNEILGDDI